MKEYGSNVQKLTDYLITLQDREQRTLYAHILVELMRQVHPNMRDGQDYSQKLWDDLYIMSEFKLDVDSPFPPPSPEAVGKKPMQVPYNQRHLKYRQYGKNMLVLIDKAVNTTDSEEKLAFVSYLIRQMKSFYTTWNKDTPDDSVVFGQLEEMSEGRLALELSHLKKYGLVDSTPRDKNSNQERRKNFGANNRVKNQGQQKNNNGNSGNNRNSNNSSGGNNRNNNRNNKWRTR